jgi:peptide/nickel transport system permease protein
VSDRPDNLVAPSSVDLTGGDDTNLSDVIVPMWRQRLRIFAHNKLAVTSVIFLVALILFCYLGPILYHTNQTDQATALNNPFNAPPSLKHLLGTDHHRGRNDLRDGFGLLGWDR